MEGYNLVASMIPDDIFTTIEALSTSFKEPIFVQTKKNAESYGLHIGNKNFLDQFVENFESLFGLYTLLEY